MNNRIRHRLETLYWVWKTNSPDLSGHLQWLFRVMDKERGDGEFIPSALIAPSDWVGAA